MPPTIWLIFFAIYSALLVLDLGVLNRESKEISVLRALYATSMWIVVALLFAAFVYAIYEYHWFGMEPSLSGHQALLQFVSGYVLEWSLSVDNIFVIVVVLAYMKIPLRYQYRVLFWGIVGAVLLRGAMIIAGAALIHRFDWTFYLFGAVLLWSALRMLKQDEEFNPEHSVIIKLVRRVFPISDQLNSDRFFTMQGSRHAATPLLIALVFVDLADVVFAVDSIPAIFAVTQDTFLVLTSNAFAILGLRALYFAVASLMALFKYLKYSLTLVLAFIGGQMILHHHLQMSNELSLLVILSLLGMGVLLSIWSNRRERKS